jgi:hypothetical protein
MVQFGVSPRVFEDKLEVLTGMRPVAVNVGVANATVQFNYRLIRNLLVPGGAHVVIYGIEMRAFRSDNGYLNDSPVGYAITQLENPARALDLWLLHHSAFFQYRNNVQEILTGERAFTIPEEIPDENGWIANDNVFDQHTLTNLEPLSTLSDNALAVSVLDNLSAFCNQPELHCIIVNMPQHPILNAHVRAADAAAYEGDLKRLVKAGIEVWDFNTVSCLRYFESSFFDLNHLNRRGALKFSEMLADLYARANTGVPLTKDSIATCVRVNEAINGDTF